MGPRSRRSPDGRTVYAPIYGNSGVGHPGIDGREMLAIDLASRKIINQVDFGRGVRPHCVVYDPASKMLYVTTELANSVTIIDPGTLKIVGEIPTTQPQSHMLAIAHDGRRGYTANVSPGSVSVLDMTARKTIAVIPISANTQRIAISRDDKLVFTSDQTKPQLAVIDTATNKIKTWIALPAIGYGAAATIDGRWLLVATSGAFHPPANGTPPPQGIDPAKSSVAVIDLASLKVVRAIPMPGGPKEILVSPDGQSAYVSCFVKIRDTTAAAPDRAVEKGNRANRGDRSRQLENEIPDRRRPGRRRPGLGRRTIGFAAAPLLQRLSRFSSAPSRRCKSSTALYRLLIPGVSIPMSTVCRSSARSVQICAARLTRSADIIGSTENGSPPDSPLSPIHFCTAQVVLRM